MRLRALAVAAAAVFALLAGSAPALAGGNPLPPGTPQAPGGLSQAHIPGIVPYLKVDKHGHPTVTDPQVPCPSGCGYEYSLAGVTIGTTAPTSGSIKMTVTQEGTKQSDGTYAGDCSIGWCIGQNHSLENFYVVGTCSTINSLCLADNPTDRPALEIQLIQGNQYCHGSGMPCFRAWSWRNGNWMQAGGYVDLSGGLQPNDGTYFPVMNDPQFSPFTLGYALSFGRINVTMNGTNVGYFPDSYWGLTTWGPVTNEVPQTEALAVGGTYGTSPYTSMNYTMSNFTDSAGDTLGTPQVGTGYTVSGASGTGWTVSGGSSPNDSGTNWQMPLAQDNGMCADNKNNAGGTNGNLVQMWHCNGGTAQRWHFDASTGEIINQAGKCLNDPAGGGAGTQLNVWTCDGNTFREWTANAGSANGYLTFTNVSNTNLCIDATSGSTTDGTKLQVYTCNGGANQDSDPWFTT